LELARASNKYLRTKHPPSIVRERVKDVTAAMWKLDPRRWNGDYDGWRYLMNGCKAAGIALDEFVAWSTQDPRYAEDARRIERQWRYAPALHSGALNAALKEAGIKVQGRGWNSPKVHGGSDTPIKPRLDGILRWLRRNTAERDLFSAACLFAEIMVE
jgi:hypothetical protein